MGTGDVQRAAALVQSIGDDVRRLADRTLAAGAVDWRSAAAEAFRARLAAEATAIRGAAGLLDDLAAGLRRHATAVDRALSIFPAGGPR